MYYEIQKELNIQYANHVSVYVCTGRIPKGGY